MASEVGLVGRLGSVFRRDGISKHDVVSDSDPRHPRAHPKGGMMEEAAVIAQQRRVALEIIKQIGANVVQGKDLLYVTFPAKCSEAQTVLQRMAESLSYSHHFLTRAAEMTDPVERFSQVMAFYVGGIHLTSGAKKPLNPLWGETYEGIIGGETKVYLEQASHHPPVTNFKVIGKGFKYYGSLGYAARFGVNELRLINKGARVVEFDDGTTITFNTPNDTFSGVMLGTYRHDVTSSIIFEDKKNELSCEVAFHKARGVPSDHCQGVITQHGKRVSTVNGSWLGYFDVDGRRYWSIEDSLKGKFEKTKPSEEPLPFDSRLRRDVVALAKGDVVDAETSKRELEENQRRDRKLRNGLTGT